MGSNLYMKNKIKERQAGLTLISMLLILSIVAFFTLAVLRLYPVYLDYFKVRSHMKSVAADPEADTYTAADIKKTLIKRFEIDNVTTVPSESVKIVSDTNKKLIEVNYEVRVNFLSNIDLVVVFADNHIEVRQR